MDDISRVSTFVNVLMIVFNNDLHRFRLCTHLVCTVVVPSIFLQLLLKNIKFRF